MQLQADASDQFIQGIDLIVAKMSNQEARRIQWTRTKFLNMWFDTWEDNLVTLGFAT
jgi:hypothetical protein